MADKTLGDLHKAKAFTPGELDAAVDAYMADPATGEYAIGTYTLDLAAAVLASTYATDLLAVSGKSDRSRRQAVKTALLLGTPTPAEGRR